MTNVSRVIPANIARRICTAFAAVIGLADHGDLYDGSAEVLVLDGVEIKMTKEEEQKINEVEDVLDNIGPIATFTFTCGEEPMRGNLRWNHPWTSCTYPIKIDLKQLLRGSYKVACSQCGREFRFELTSTRQIDIYGIR